MVAVGELPEAAALAVTTLSSGAAEMIEEVHALLVTVIGRSATAVRARRHRAPPPRLRPPRIVAGPYDVGFRSAWRSRPPLSAPTGPAPRVVADLHRWSGRFCRCRTSAPDWSAQRSPPATPGPHTGHRTRRLVAARTPVPLWHTLADQSQRVTRTATRTRSARRSTAAHHRRRPALADALLDLANALSCAAGRHATQRTSGALYARIGAPATRRSPIGAAPTSPPPCGTGHRSTDRGAGA